MIETEVDATEVAVVAAMLASDNVPDQNQDVKCFSCKAPMKGLYCTECGQKNDNYRRSIFALAGELIGSIFSLDSRLWRSWAALLFRPGLVARQFADGRRSHWSSPVRVYLAMSIILFGFMNWTNTHLVSVDIEAKVKDGIVKPLDEMVFEDLETDWDINFFERQRDIDARNEDRNFDLLKIWLAGRSEKTQAEAAAILGDVTDEVDEKIQTAIQEGEEVPEIIQNLPTIGIQTDTENADGGIILNGESFGGAQNQDALMRFIKNPAIVTSSFNKWLPRLMFIMMPFTMLFGALFIRDKKKGLLFDHLVHAAYIHGFAFFLFLSGILLSKVFPGGPVFQGIFILLLIYLPLSLKKMFGRGWFKTFLASYAVGFMYLLIVSIALLSLMSWDVSQAMAV